MDAVQQASSQTAATGAATGIKSKKDTENPQDRFLKLLVTQMKNQDPLKPLDNAEVTSQLAQISTVSGIDKLNSTLQQLVTSAEDNRSVEALGLIGHQAFVPGTSINLSGDGAIAGMELAQPVDQLKVTILDSAGIAIRTMELGAQPTGLSTIAWDGKTDSGTQAVDGDYTFAVSAKQGGNDIKVDTLSFGKVNSVMPGEGGAHLDMGDKLGLVGLSDIKQVF
ncbi:flagellar basal-body rod modification protein FlgD [Nitrosomonas oligotropha]|uniref:Basal-body rod modification protein FlgD n=1 Tax=Nitrosomonas oligotropha TaxID=42354 RepID=A0A2T5I3B8_9PROT|nr:flagellar hook assembly protein FlgD [Nitrosomonas oligotropha]PTQ78306.1 flagellar basal-body rod modification protein FlgD [Nitrosomonas oligotropha]